MSGSELSKPLSTSEGSLRARPINALVGNGSFIEVVLDP